MDTALTDAAPLDVESLRRETPGSLERIHLNNAGAAMPTQRTIDAMTSHLMLEATIGGYEAADAARDRIEATRASLAALVGGQQQEVALFDNSTHAWNAACYSVPLRAGDRILTCRAEYGSSVLAYLQLAKRTGAEVVVVPNDESGQVDIEALRGLVDERTRMIGLTWIPTSGGLVNPAAEVGAVARDADVLYLLDATQAVGQLPIDVDALGCDLLTGTGRKFLRGPRGTGFLWAGERALERLEPFVVEIAAAEWDGERGFSWRPGARRFETWENSYLNVLGLGAAVDQALDLGLEAIGARAIALGARLRDGLDAVDGVTTHDLGTTRCAIVTAKVDGMSAAEVADRLRAERVNVSTTVPGHTQFDTEVRDVHPLVRLSPHYYNTEDEVDLAIDLIADMARSDA